MESQQEPTEKINNQNQQKKAKFQKDKLGQMSKQQLINKINVLLKDKKRLETRLAQFQPQKQRVLRQPNKKKVQKIFEDYECKKYALKICYIGLTYDGMAIQIDTDNTIERYLFQILYTLSLISNPMPGEGYTRAGRTDKGVSAMGNIISLPLRTNILKNQEGINTMNYCSMMNSLLPQDIRIISFCEVSPEFNSRYWCLRRSYKYFFARNNLNLEAMKKAIVKFEGSHNFVNYCKMNLSNTVNFQRIIFKAQICKVQNQDESKIKDYKDYRNQIYYFHFVGNSFLWHQIRFMATILFLVGNGQEQQTIVEDLFDLKKYPRKPNYALAPEYPLILEDCEFDNLKFEYNPQITYNFYNCFNQMVMRKSVERTLLINCMIMAKQSFLDNIKLSNQIFLEQTQKLTTKVLSKKKKPLAIHKSSARGLEEAIKSLKGKKLDLYQKKAQKQAQYQEKKKKQQINNKFQQNNDNEQDYDE